MSETEVTKPTTTAPTQTLDKKYNPRLPPYQDSDFLLIYFSRFVDSMRAAQIPTIQWISHLRDLLTGKLLKTFQDLPENNKLSFDTVK